MVKDPIVPLPMNSPLLNWLAYAGSIALSTGLLLQENHLMASFTLSLGVVLLPKTDLPWRELPLWRKITTAVHLGLAAGLLGYAVGFNDR